MQKSHHCLRSVFFFSVIIGIVIPAIFAIRYLAGVKDDGADNLLFSVFFTFTVSCCIYLVDMPIWKFVIKKFPWKTHFKKRIIGMIFLSNLAASVVMFLVYELFYEVFASLLKNCHSSHLIDHIIIANIVNVIMILGFESSQLYRYWKDSIIKQEQLQREAMEAKFEALQSQINPHFLFNSLNVLVSLIRIDQKKAIDYTQKFSQIYRYILDTSTDKMVTLDREIFFIENYLFLQNLRFGENLKFEMIINEKPDRLLLPPLSLQILVENAILHNEISTEFPLMIQIRIDADWLTVRNNLQLRKDPKTNSGKGLKNLNTRMLHLQQSEPVIEKTEKEFIVKIPLLHLE